MARNPNWKVGQKATLRGTVVRTLEDDPPPIRVALALDGWNTPVTLHETSLKRLDPRTEGIAEDEPVETTATVTRIGQGAFGTETISVRLDTGQILSMSADSLT